VSTPGNVPAPNSGFVAVAGGYAHSLGLKADGSLVAWGYNGFGQYNVPAPNSGFVAVAAGANHSLGLKHPLLRSGDPNCSGSVGFDDINPFVLALTDPATYATAFPGCTIANADINADGAVDFKDINRFVVLLTGD
jgi:alpha-tubulin suppressor-like RCC1 family protein